MCKKIKFYNKPYSLEAFNDAFTELTPKNNILNKLAKVLLLTSVSSLALAQTGYPMDELVDTANPIIEKQAQVLKTNYGVDTSQLMISEDALSEFQQEGVHGTTIKNPEFLYEITPDNYKYIIRNGISGVYANPALEGEITVLYFNNDKRDNPHNLIRNQFIELGNSSFGYENDFRMLELYKFSSTAIKGFAKSVHSFSSNHGYKTDANTALIVVDNLDKDTYNTVNITTMSTILHESAHGYENTRWSKEAPVFALVTDFKYWEAEEEISARSGDRILTHQFAEKTGELKNLKLFKDINIVPQLILDPQNTDGHLNYFVDHTFNDVVKEYPDVIRNMSKNQIYKYSTEMVKQSNEYDFTRDLMDKIKNHIIENNFDKYLDSTSKYTHLKRIEFFENQVNGLEDIIESIENKGLNSVISQRFEDYVNMIILREFSVYLLKDAKDNPYGSIESTEDLFNNLDSVVDIVVNRLNTSGDPILITNFDNNHLAAYAGSQGFIENFKSTKTFKNIVSETPKRALSELL